MPKGIRIEQNRSGLPVFYLHYSAKHDRDSDWVKSERPKYSTAMWNQEQEMDFSAAGGERILRELLDRRWKEIVITDPAWEPDPNWTYSAGMDYGKSHPAALIGCAMDFSGTRYALCEHFHAGMTPSAHVPAMKKLSFPLNDPGKNTTVLAKAEWTACDPSMGYANVATEERFTSYVELFTKAGYPNLRTGIRGRDKNVADEIEDCWNQPDPTFKIVLRPSDTTAIPTDIGSLKKREGTYSWGCPNLLWELSNLRRVERSAARQETAGPAEALMDKDNDAFDALCYWWTSQTIAPKVSKEQRWKNRVKELREKNPEIDLTSLAFHQQRWAAEEAKQEVRAWR